MSFDILTSWRLTTNDEYHHSDTWLRHIVIRPTVAQETTARSARPGATVRRLVTLGLRDCLRLTPPSLPVAGERPAAPARCHYAGRMTALTLNRLLEMEKRGWDSLCRSRGGTFYGELMTREAVMILTNGLVLDREMIAGSLNNSPPWAS